MNQLSPEHCYSLTSTNGFSPSMYGAVDQGSLASAGQGALHQLQPPAVTTLNLVNRAATGMREGLSRTVITQADLVRSDGVAKATFQSAGGIAAALVGLVFLSMFRHFKVRELRLSALAVGTFAGAGLLALPPYASGAGLCVVGLPYALYKAHCWLAASRKDGEKR